MRATTNSTRMLAVATGSLEIQVHGCGSGHCCCRAATTTTTGAAAITSKKIIVFDNNHAERLQLDSAKEDTPKDELLSKHPEKTMEHDDNNDHDDDAVEEVSSNVTQRQAQQQHQKE